MQATEDEVFDTYRDIVDKGKGRNDKRMINMKADIMKPPRANTMDQLELTLSRWKQEQDWVTQWDSSSLSEDQQKSILMGAMPLDHVPYMREHFKDAELATYESFEQELFQRMDETNMDEEPNRDKKLV